MMYKRSNLSNSPLGKSLLVVVIGGVLLLPEVGFASERKLLTQRARVNFCSAVDAFADRLKKDMSDNEVRFSSKESERQDTLSAKLAKQDAERQSTRFNWDNSRDKVYSELSTRADTEAKKAAIEKFKAAIDAAVTLRRASVDKATSDFKSNVDKGIAARKSAVETATTQFRAETDAALLAAKEDCTKGVPPATARTRYVTSLEAAHKKLEVSLSGLKNPDALKSLVSERQAAIEQAAKEFKAAVAKAENALKLAFPDA